MLERKRAVVIIIFAGLSLLGLVSFFIFKSRVFNSRVSDSNIIQIFGISKNQGIKEIGKNLEEVGLIKSRYYFYFQLKSKNLAEKIQAGEYELSPNMKVGEIIDKFVDGEVKLAYEKLIIPEGFTNAKIIERVSEIDPKLGKEFEEIINCHCVDGQECACENILNKYNFLNNLPPGVDLEGYLFPDTYFIYPEDDATKLATKFLNNFEKKITLEMINDIKSQEKTLHEVLTLASIVEKEVRSDDDKEIVAGIFWNRVNDNYLLQSCATLAYILGEDKKQYSYEDTQIESPFNTYLNIGLPPGPVSNPGLSSIKASIYPEESEYYYFLSDPKTGETIFSKISKNTTLTNTNTVYDKKNTEIRLEEFGGSFFSSGFRLGCNLFFFGWRG